MRPTWINKIYSEFIDVLYLLNHPFRSTPGAIVLKYNYDKLIKSMRRIKDFLFFYPFNKAAIKRALSDTETMLTIAN